MRRHVKSEYNADMKNRIGRDDNNQKQSICIRQYSFQKVYWSIGYIDKQMD